MIIDLIQMQKKQSDFIEFLENRPNMINEKSEFKITKKQILAAISELYEIGNEAKNIYKWWDKSEIDRDKLIEELSDLLSHILNMSNSLGVELKLCIKLKEGINLESQILSLNYDFIRFDSKTNIGFDIRRIKDLIIPKYINLVYSLGFNIDELTEAYYKKLESNYKRFEV